MHGSRNKIWTWSFVPLAAILMPINANADGPLVDIQSVNPTIVVELRYAGNNNLVKHPLYPQGTRALARPEVVAALTKAQTTLRRFQYGLKIWDAYRPAAVQTKLWQASRNSDYVANPEVGVGSLHSWGIAVDAAMGNASRRVLGNAHRMVAFYGLGLEKILAGRSTAICARRGNSVDR